MFNAHTVSSIFSLLFYINNFMIKTLMKYVVTTMLDVKFLKALVHVALKKLLT